MFRACAVCALMLTLRSRSPEWHVFAGNQSHTRTGKLHVLPGSPFSECATENDVVTEGRGAQWEGALSAHRTDQILGQRKGGLMEPENMSLEERQVATVPGRRTRGRQRAPSSAT